MKSIDQIRLVVALKPIPPGQITLYKTLYEAGERWVSKSELANAMRWGDHSSLHGVLGALGRRANTKGVSDRLGIRLLLEQKQINGELHYRMSPELKAVIDSLPLLREAMKLSVDKIQAKYEQERDWLSISVDTNRLDVSKTEGSYHRAAVSVECPENSSIVPKTRGMRLISWNLNGRVAKLREQIQALVQYQPDVVVLQEVLISTVPILKKALSEAGLPHGSDSYSLAADLTLLTRRRRYGELLASRWPLSPLSPDGFPVPWTERILSVMLDSPWGKIEMHTTGIPPGVTNGWLEVEMFEGIYNRLACCSKFPRVLCGDLNTPQAESSDGQVTTWGQEILRDAAPTVWTTWRDPQGRVDTGERWDLAERNILVKLADFDLSDVFRSLNGYEVKEFSWYWRSNGRKIGRRFDHVFASKSLNPVRCRYLHSLRERGLSDHSPIEADFDPQR